MKTKPGKRIYKRIAGKVVRVVDIRPDSDGDLRTMHNSNIERAPKDYLYPTQFTQPRGRSGAL